MGYMDMLIKGVMEGYSRRLIQLAMIALMSKPSAVDDNKVTGFYFDTSGNTATTQIIPYSNGFQTFLASESHYLGYTAYADSILSDLRRKVTGKGYGAGGVTYFATESTWDAFKALSSWSSETKHMFELADGFFTQRNGNQYITVGDGEMPDDYLLCLDTTEKILYKREDNFYKGLMSRFAKLGQAQAIEEADFKIVNIGYGVQSRGAGAVAQIVAGGVYATPSFYGA